MSEKYIIEYVSNPSTALGLPSIMRWNIYRVEDKRYYHIEGFRTKKAAKEYKEEYL